MRRLLLGLAVAVLVVPAGALAVWGGTPDTAHPGVGAMYWDANGDGTVTADDLICSGSYAGRSKDTLSEVFLTAGHCIPEGTGIPAGALYVSFDANAGDGVSGAIAVSSYHQMPGFGHDAGDFHDLGILLLRAGTVPAGTPAVQLPTAGYLDALKASGGLKFRIVDLVGYGVVPVWDPAGPTQYAFDGVRRSGTSIVTGLTKSLLLFNQNRHGIGTGSGLCFGDSGSPQLERGTLLVLSVTSGGNGQCNANNVNYRVDTPQARAFLGRFLTLP